VMFAVTPLRNALTVAASNQTSSFVQIYAGIFRGGARGAWVGGAFTMLPAVPQFCVLGPMFHVYRQALGGSAGAAVVATALTETLIAYGAETRNAQLAVPGRAQGVILHNPMRPFGPGVGVHLLRNTIAMSGLRVLSEPCQRGVRAVCEATNVKMQPTTCTVLSDLVANLAASALSTPFHQLYCFLVISAVQRAPGAPTPSAGETVVEAAAFLRKAFLVPGTNRPSSLALRDISLRCAYNATIFTLFGAIERGSIDLWSSRGWS